MLAYGSELKPYLQTLICANRVCNIPTKNNFIDSKTQRTNNTDNRKNALNTEKYTQYLCHQNKSKNHTQRT